MGKGVLIGAACLCVLIVSPAHAGITVADFRQGDEEFMGGSVRASGYGACSGPEVDGCFGTYLYGHIRPDDGSCPADQGNLAVSAVLPRDGAAVTAPIDGDPAVRGWNRLCAYVERVYWSGVTAVIARGSAVAYSKGPVPDDDLYDCSSFPDHFSAQSYLDDWPWDPSNLDADEDGVACNEGSVRGRLVRDPGGTPLPTDLWLSAAEARRHVNRALGRVFKRAFSRRGLSRRCRRRTRVKVACRVAWDAGASDFSGNVAVRKAVPGKVRYGVRVRRLARGGARLVERSGSL